MQGTARSHSSQMSLGSPMEIDYSMNVGHIEVLVSKPKFCEEEKSGKNPFFFRVSSELELRYRNIIFTDIVMMDEVDILDKSPGEQLGSDLLMKFSNIYL